MTALPNSSQIFVQPEGGAISRVLSVMDRWEALCPGSAGCDVAERVILALLDDCRGWNIPYAALRDAARSLLQATERRGLEHVLAIADEEDLKATEHEANEARTRKVAELLGIDLEAAESVIENRDKLARVAELAGA